MEESTSVWWWMQLPITSQQTTWFSCLWKDFFLWLCGLVFWTHTCACYLHLVGFLRARLSWDLVMTGCLFLYGLKVILPTRLPTLPGSILGFLPCIWIPAVRLPGSGCLSSLRLHRAREWPIVPRKLHKHAWINWEGVHKSWNMRQCDSLADISVTVHSDWWFSYYEFRGKLGMPLPRVTFPAQLQVKAGQRGMTWNWALAVEWPPLPSKGCSQR